MTDPDEAEDTFEMVVERHQKNARGFLIFSYYPEEDHYHMDCQMTQDQLVMALATVMGELGASARANLLHHLITQPEVRVIHQRMLMEIAEQEAAQQADIENRNPYINKEDMN